MMVIRMMVLINDYVVVSTVSSVRHHEITLFAFISHLLLMLAVVAVHAVHTRQSKRHKDCPLLIVST